MDIKEKYSEGVLGMFSKKKKGSAKEMVRSKDSAASGNLKHANKT